MRSTDLVRFAGWNCVEATADRVDMAHTLWPSPGYPFTLQIQIAYQVDEVGLTVTTTTRNVGTTAAPYGAGQHPYIVPPAGVSVDDCELLVPAQQYLETDDRGLPTSAHPVTGSEFDFTTSRPDRHARTRHGVHRSHARRPRPRSRRARAERGQSIQLWVDDSYKYIQVFTGDTLPEPRRRRSIAVEPMTCPPNAFATGIDVVRLEPDETATTSWGIVLPDQRVIALMTRHQTMSAEHNSVRSHRRGHNY